MQPKFLIDDGKRKRLAYLKLKNFKCTRLPIDFGNFSPSESPSRLNTLNNVNFFRFNFLSIQCTVTSFGGENIRRDRRGVPFSGFNLT